jgi:hypothetical protein
MWGDTARCPYQPAQTFLLISCSITAQIIKLPAEGFASHAVVLSFFAVIENPNAGIVASRTLEII